jgi:signal transduction histidine kinase
VHTYTHGFAACQPFEMEYRLRGRDGEYRWIFDRGVPRFSEDNLYVGYIGSCIDITNRKPAEEDLAGVSGRLIEAQERDRTRIARDLHDDFSQSLAL